MMNSEKSLHERKVLRNSLLIGMTNIILVSFFDKEFIPADKYPYYLLIQVAAFIPCLYIFLKNIKGEVTQEKFLALFNIYSWYAILCQFFIPCSFMSYIVSLFVVGLFSNLKGKKFLITGAIYTALMIAAINVSDMSYATTESLTDKFKLDSSQTLLGTCVLILIAHYYRLKQIAKTEFLSNKLLNLGGMSMTFIHDIKGQLTTPINHARYLLKNNRENLEIIQDLNESLNYTKDYVFDINQAFSVKSEIVDIELKEVMEAIRRFYLNKQSNILFMIKQKTAFKGDIFLIRNILTNLAINSQNAFAKNFVKNPEIFISYEDNCLIFKDNAGGFSKEALSKIKNGDMFTESNQGSGVGLYTIRSYVDSFDGRMEIYNENECAVVKITFPLKKKGVING